MYQQLYHVEITEQDGEWFVINPGFQSEAQAIAWATTRLSKYWPDAKAWRIRIVPSVR